MRYMLHHRLAVLLNTRGTDVFNLELDEQKKRSSRGVSLSCPGKDYLLAIRGTDVDPHTSIPLYNLKVIVSGTRNLSSNDGHPLWGAPSSRDHMMPGAIEPGLRLNNVITSYLLFCPRIGNT
ncbi:hypothetical protein AVEN_268036-1 [Araneus ventricosus]|uniref:Uncharacterized protein n=1 Tax=Araneus ventricosus TaxID=182803 RepID=A0A4Y2KBJ2_ARAVE|nr:hypothetical protein AVEN_268036-1 [Araneus ventricosus]